jgi:hypothetical protein
MTMKRYAMPFRLLIILLWGLTLGILVKAGYAKAQSPGPYVGLALGLIALAALPLLRPLNLVQKTLSFLFPILLLISIVGNIQQTNEYTAKQRLYNSNNNDRLHYWFDRYALKMRNTSFYLSMRDILAGSSLVVPDKDILKEYDVKNIAWLKQLSVEKYGATGINSAAFHRLQKESGLKMQQLTMLQVWRKNKRRMHRQIPFLVFSHQDGHHDTYYLHTIKIDNSQKRNLSPTAYLAVPRAVHNTLVSSNNSKERT